MKVPPPPMPLVAERMLAGVIFWWGFILALPHDSFGDGKGYSAMAEVAPDWIWGSAMLSVGICQWIGIVAARRLGLFHQRLRRAVLFAELALFPFIAAAVLVGNPWAVTWGWCVIFTAGALRTLHRV